MGKFCIKPFRNTFQRSDRSRGGGRPAKHADPNGTHLFKPTTTNLLLYEAPMDSKTGLIGQIGFQNLSVCSLKGHLFYYVTQIWVSKKSLPRPHVRLVSRQHGVQSSKGFLPQLNPCKMILLTIPHSSICYQHFVFFHFKSSPLCFLRVIL